MTGYAVAGALLVVGSIVWNRVRSRRKLIRMLTPRAGQVLALARRSALAMHHGFTGPEHLLLGILMLGQGVAVEVLKSQGLDLEKGKKTVETMVGIGPDKPSLVPYTQRTICILMQAMKEAKLLKQNFVGVEHLLLALLGSDAGVATMVFKECGIDAVATRNQILTAIAQQGK